MTTANDDLKVKQLISEIEQGCNGFSPDRFKETRLFISDIIKHYSDFIGVSELTVLEKLEGARTYSAPNYYQKANFPRLDIEGVYVYQTAEELRTAIKENKFRCPACSGVSTDPYECNSGVTNKENSVCNWKSYGFYGTMGKGIKFIVIDNFLENPKIHEIFMPLAMENKVND